MCQPGRIKFASRSRYRGLSEAVALASELRVVAHARVQIRPGPRRLLDRRWKVALTIPEMPHAARVRTELRELAHHHSGCRLVEAAVRVLIVDDS